VKTITHSTSAEKPVKRARATGVSTPSPTVESDFLPRLVTQKLRQFARDAETSAWTKLKSQGAVAKGLAIDPYATHSRFYWTGTGLSFRQWRFAFRARLNVLHSRVQLARFTRATGGELDSTYHRCRCCGNESETVPHVLNHCLPLMSMITARHNSIVNRLVEALPRSIAKFLLDRNPFGRRAVRPDLIVWKADGEIVIVDVACPYEGHEDNIESAFQRKVEKYTPLAIELASGAVRSVVVRPFIIGALGGWHPGNEQCLDDLGIKRHRRKLLRQLCVADSIAGSEAIWRKLECGLTDQRTADPTAVPSPPIAGRTPASSDGAALRAPSAR